MTDESVGGGGRSARPLIRLTAALRKLSASAPRTIDVRGVADLLSEAASEVKKHQHPTTVGVDIEADVQPLLDALLTLLSATDKELWRPEAAAAGGAPARCMEAATALLAAVVAACRRSEVGLAKDVAMRCTDCANALVNMFLLNQGRQLGGGGSPGLSNTLRHIYHSIALGVIEAEGSDEEPDPMAPLEVGRVFDAYSTSYDEAMQSLQYSVPGKISAWVAEQQAQAKPPRLCWRTVADLGCGTGLMGKVTRAACAHLSGCDISPGMVLTAAELRIYDELAVQDCCSFLDGRPAGSLDLVIAADVVEYIGDVGALFRAAAAALAPQGHLIVSAESLEASAKRHGLPESSCQEGFCLLPSERYAHTAEYLQAAAAGAALQVVDVSALECLREEEDERLPGWLCFLRKG